MAQPFDVAGWWLPSPFLPDDERLALAKDTRTRDNGLGFNRHGADSGLDTELAHNLSNFPSEFPYEIDSPVESVLSSTETESSDEEDFLAGLTRGLTQSPIYEPQTQRLGVPCFTRNKPEKLWVLSGSPKSTLSGIGSWSSRSLLSRNESPKSVSQMPSPPTTPFGADSETWDLVYAAAMEVARLKMTCDQEPKYGPFHHQNRGLLVESSPNSAFYSGQRVAHGLTRPTQRHAREEQVLKRQSCRVWGTAVDSWPSEQLQQRRQQPLQQIQGKLRTLGFANGRCGRNQGLPQSTWSLLPGHHHQSSCQLAQNGSVMRTPFINGSGPKRECAGTGVFLPRRPVEAPESRKKSGGSMVLVPPKVVQALHLNVAADGVNGHSRPCFNDAFARDDDVSMARRNGVPKGGFLNHETRLPQEWTY